MFVQSQLVNERAHPQSVIHFFVRQDSGHKLKIFLGGNIISVPTSEPLSHFGRFCDFKADIEGFRSNVSARSQLSSDRADRGLSVRAESFGPTPS